MSLPQGCSVSASKKMSWLTPFIRSTDNPATSLSISVAPEEIFFDMVPCWQLSLIFLGGEVGWGAGQGANRHLETAQPVSLSFPVLGELLSVGLTDSFLRVQENCKPAPVDAFFFFFLAGKFAAIIASGRRKAPNGKETALSFATILLRSLNIISSPRLSLDSYLAHSHRSFKAPLRCHLSWEDSLTPQSVVGGAAQWS